MIVGLGSIRVTSDCVEENGLTTRHGASFLFADLLKSASYLSCHSTAYTHCRK